MIKYYHKSKYVDYLYFKYNQENLKNTFLFNCNNNYHNLKHEDLKF
jgi:hypothetical protein